ncbi:hypothetical protein SEA_APIARY_73 [Rhodococcus phage Apiary]|nr:hypothetical protein SEA_BRAXOADDIE_73 [Rhodococcus phage Braxoaddie]WNM64996.1 hypothetical protein SEA_MASELOP_73 [Rhodococcus phage Maselop]WNM67457.1 hypothetical protein SEA_POLYYUKI_73 [Rhodococcus phage Polyyuki]WNM69881.1 hypothetical protein SEA_APIARY_73 [Rhodococcus phage Apiary]
MTAPIQRPGLQTWKNAPRKPHRVMSLNVCVEPSSEGWAAYLTAYPSLDPIHVRSLDHVARAVRKHAADHTGRPIESYRIRKITVTIPRQES